MEFELKLLSLGNEEINENFQCFFKIELGSQTKQSKNYSFKNKKIEFDEKINLCFKNEKMLKVTFWYIENDNKFVLIGNGDLDLTEVSQKKNLENRTIQILKEGKENGSCDINLRILN